MDLQVSTHSRPWRAATGNFRDNGAVEHECGLLREEVGMGSGANCKVISWMARGVVVGEVDRQGFVGSRGRRRSKLAAALARW